MTLEEFKSEFAKNFQSLKKISGYEGEEPSEEWIEKEYFKLKNLGVSQWIDTKPQIHNLNNDEDIPT